jgi:AraC family transcriptional activator of pyochelin receptor
MLIHLTDADLEKLALVRETILKNIRYHHTIPYLAHAAGLNEFKLKTGFKSVYGQPLFDFLTDQRMKLAIQLLESGNYTVSEIAYRCGYNHPTNFCAAFRRRFHVKPTEYKKTRLYAVKNTAG